MPFDAGNLITLGIVIVVLAAYRYLDRENRSLEKVKKFADRIRDELIGHIAWRLLAPALQLSQPVRLLCQEEKPEKLFAELEVLTKTLSEKVQTKGQELQKMEQQLMSTR